MPQKLLQVVSLQVLHSAGQQTFRIRMRHFLQKCMEGYALISRDVQAFVNAGGAELLEDSASLRAWMWSVGCLDRAERTGGSSIPLDAIDHLRVDASYRHRVGELLFWQLLGIVAGQALRNRRSFHFAVPHPPPERLQLDGVGRLTLAVERVHGQYVIRVEGNACAIATEGPAFCVKFDTTSAVASQNFTFTPAHRIAPGTCLSFDNDTLSRQFFQPLPLLVGKAGNAQFGEQLRRCWSAVEASGIDGLSQVLGLCDSLIGLVSLSECIGSGSREEALGLVFLPAGTADVNLAECLVHESLHQLLFRIEESADVFVPEISAPEHFYSPWRTDGRSLRMVLHGAFVFSGIASLHIHWHQQPQSTLTGSLDTAFRRMEESAMALETVHRHGVLSAVGTKVVAAVEAEIVHARGLLDETQFPGVRDAIRQRQNEFSSLIG